MSTRKSTFVTGLVCLLFVAALTGCAPLPQAAGSGSDQTAALQQQLVALEAENAGLLAQNALLKELAGPLPASLDNYFPPKAPAPIWLFEMFALSAPLEGIMVDLQQGDMEGVQANYDAFAAQYAKMAEMVPEWKDQFPQEPVVALGEALQSGDPAQVGPAMGQVGQVCGSCHLVNQSKAFFRYHWPAFAEVRLPDPVSGEEVSWTDYMFGMAGAFTGIGNDLAQGQLDNARQNFEAFSARIKALPEDGCVQCHATPRTYFVDASVMALVDQLGEALQADQPDPEAIGALSGAIGDESCMKCHLVHVPAAAAQARTEIFADLFK